MGGFEGLAKFIDVARPPPPLPAPAAGGDTVEVSVEGSEGFGEDSAIKQPSLASTNGGWNCLESMDRRQGLAEATRYVDILAEVFRLLCDNNQYLIDLVARLANLVH